MFVAVFLFAVLKGKGILMELITKRRINCSRVVTVGTVLPFLHGRHLMKHVHEFAQFVSATTLQGRRYFCSSCFTNGEAACAR